MLMYADLYIYIYIHIYNAGDAGMRRCARLNVNPHARRREGLDPVGPQPSGVCSALGLAWHTHTAVGRAVGGAAALVAALRTARAVRRPKPYSCCAALRKASGSSAEQLVGCTRKR